jgi:hypothetical protein
MHRRDASNTAHALANQANSSFKMADTVLVSLVDKVEVEGWSAATMARLRALMMKHMADLPALQGLFIYDENGRWIVNSAGTQFDGRNNSDRAYFQYHKQHPGRRLHVGAPIVGRTSGVWIIPVSRRIDRPDGSFAGVALATIKIDFVRKVYEGLDIGSDGRILMTLDDGTLLLRVPFDTASIGRDTRAAPLFRLRGRDADIDGATFIHTESRVGEYLARVAVLWSKDAALRPWRHSAILSYLALAVLIAGLLLLGRHVVRQIALRDQLQRDLAAHYGGEEFVVLLPDTDLAGAREVADKIHANVAALGLQHEASPLGVVTISVGADAAVPEQADDADRAFGARADAALYRAKEAGRNCTAT